MLYLLPRAAVTNYHDLRPAGLRTTEIYPLTVLETRSLKSSLL